MTPDDCLIERTGDTWRLQLEERYATDVDELWQAITDPGRLARFMATYRGEFRVGGTWEAIGSSGDVYCVGVVQVCDPPRGFTTTWQVRGEHETRLEVRLVPDGGGTRLVLRHDGISDTEYGPGWHVYLEALGRYLDDPIAHAERDDAWWDARFAEIAPAYEPRFTS
ncbi:hypothetical protein FLP10_13700 [Agromyces intestinalis]|uniref:Activator of Hsp90 ATPase homologue 1/2-like C-terminal domain-containing protein n=1 Tax=Agromyces intestinalis TaxID=2592652 RepID=A0A5C1YHC8_9MICO|nr:SRPBCC domain-containing protein [Agromyces intestinalis]QEO15363.1 hypothetical protein FLP10_13700 [Agromyces intestinalis]